MVDRTRGFSFIELLITVSIIGILSGVAVPAYRSYIQTANMTKVNAAFEQAIRVVRHELQKSSTRVAMGLPATAPQNAKEWVKRLDPQGKYKAPGGGPLYSYSGDGVNPTEAGSIRLWANQNLVQIRRPAYLELETRLAKVSASGVSMEQ